jgi:hypothetical protein
MDESASRSPAITSRAPESSLARWLPAFVFSVTLAAGVLTSGWLGIVWDEPFYQPPRDRMARWFSMLLGPDTFAEALSHRTRKDHWLCCQKHPSQYLHPPVATVLSLVTRTTTGWLLGPQEGLRLAPTLLFALAAAAIADLVRRSHGSVAALAATAAWSMHPHLFGIARVATPDMPAASFALLTAWSLARFLEDDAAPILPRRRFPSWLFGVLAGLTLMTKAPAALVVVPSIALGLSRRPRRMIRPLLQAAFVGPLVVWLANPGWWTDPVRGFLEFVEGNRVFSQVQRIPTYYLGQLHPQSLPWHNVIVLLVATMPTAWFALSLIGLIPSVRGSRLGVMALAHALVFLVLRSLPGVPGNDSIRHLLPAFGFLAILVGIGFASVVELVPPRWRTAFGALLLALAVGSTLWSWRPYVGAELTYFSPTIGGVRGANRLGLEITYFWEVVDRDSLAALDRLPPGTGIAIPVELKVFASYQEQGRLRRDLRFFNPLVEPHQPYDHLLMINRAGMMPPRQRELFAGPAVFTREIDGVRVLALVKLGP